MSDIRFYPKNDLAFTIQLNDVNITTGVKTPLTTGSLSVFIATTDAPDAVAADNTLTGTATHLGSGKWLIYVDAAKLQDVVMLDGHFTDGSNAYVILEQTNNIRVAVPVVYTRAFDATVA